MKDCDSRYEILDHTADIGIVVYAKDVKSLFAAAALAMTDIMVSGDSGSKKKKRRFTIDAEDYPDLMVRWLGEVLYLFAGERLVTTAAIIADMDDTSIKAELVMTDFNPDCQEVLREIKAVTFHGIRVEETGSIWKAQVIFDI
ncbi:MAG: archease [Spirochaetales bacterium]|nr:archease [Spirochaetales bacterium]